MSAGGSQDYDDDLFPIGDSETVEFDVVRFGGYDRRQVDDHFDRVDAALNDFEQRHAADSARITSLQGQLSALQTRLAETEALASGRPEAASRLTERLAEMLRLAEEEAAAVRADAQGEAERLVAAAKQQAARDNAERAAGLEVREREVLKRHEQAEVSIVEAQRDAEAERAQAKREVDNLLMTARREAELTRSSAQRDAKNTVDQARQDVQLLHEQARKEAGAMTAEARRQVEQFSRQRDAIAAQLQQLRDAVSAAVAPLGGPGLVDSAADAPFGDRAEVPASAGTGQEPRGSSTRISRGD